MYEIRSDLHEKHRDELIKSAQEALGELEKKKSVWTRRSLAALLFASVSALIATFAHFALDPVMTKIAIPEEISQSLISQTVASEGKRVAMSDTEAGMDLVLALLDSPAVKALPLIIVTMGFFTGIARQSVFAVIIPIAAGLALYKMPTVMKSLVGSGQSSAYEMVYSHTDSDYPGLIAKLATAKSIEDVWGAQDSADAKRILQKLTEPEHHLALSRLLELTPEGSEKQFVEIQIAVLNNFPIRDDYSAYVSPESVDKKYAYLTELAVHSKPVGERAVSYAKDLGLIRQARDLGFNLALSLMVPAILFAAFSVPFRRNGKQIESWLNASHGT